MTTDKPGLWWNNGTKWMPMYPRTLKYLDEFHPGWRDLGDGTPARYSIDGDILTISPPPETTLADGFWLYYGQRPTQMSSGDHYPFSGTTTEFTHLSLFDMAIILYAKWKIEPMLNKKFDSQISIKEYNRERDEKDDLFYRRADLSNDRRTRFTGPRVGPC